MTQTTFIEDIILNVRRDTRNLDAYSSTNQTGISDEDFIRYYNYGQERAFGLIAATKAKVFISSKDFEDITASDSFYEISDNVYLGSSIVDVKFSHTGENKDLRELREKDISYLNHEEVSTYPNAYVRENGKIGLTPRVNNASAKMRVRYRRMVDRVDKRRGTVTARTLSATQLTALTLDIATDDATALGTAQYLCVCNKYGVVQMYNIPITSYAAGTGVVTLPAFTFASGETVAVGDYVTIGQYTRTHTQLPRDIERYPELYATLKVFGRDSNLDIDSIKGELSILEKQIETGYSLSASDDESEIQIEDPELLLGY